MEVMVAYKADFVTVRTAASLLKEMAAILGFWARK